MANDATLVQSQERRRKRRQQRTDALLVALALVLGLLFGWIVLGWAVFPGTPAVEPAALSPDAQMDYVELTVEAWSATGDTAQAQERLRGLDLQLASILNDLRTVHALSGEPTKEEAVTAFARSIGLTLPPPANVLGAAADSGPLPTRLPFKVAVSKDVPPNMLAAIQAGAREQNATLVGPGEQAEVTVGTDPRAGSILLAERYYVVVDRFATLRDSFSLEQLHNLWNGQATADGASMLLVTPEAVDGLDAVLGSRGANVQTVSAGDMATRLYTDTTTLGVVAFDQLIPRLSALAFDGQNILAHDFRSAAYPLVTRVYVSGQSAPAQRLVAGVRLHLPRTNRDPERITTLIMTGTTAVTRGAAVKIEEKKDPAYPARVIGPTLAAADITHISNEIPFTDYCQPLLNTMAFCSKPSYMATFKLAGVKIVGLTGNHLLDFGTAPFVKTLDMYDTAGLKYYGGGRNATEAARPLLLEDHGNRITLIGMNSNGPPGVWATAGQPGALRYDASTLKKMISDAHSRSDVVFVELQADETSGYEPNSNNRLLFRATLAAGADVVTGVQAHQPQAYEFAPDAHRLILYGLGNLFFDQMFELGVRQELIARHTIYQGRLIQTELLTAMLEDSVQPRWMTPAERAVLLTSLAQASIFK